MSRAHLVTLSISLLITLPILLQVVYTYGFCPLCEKGVSTKSYSRYELMSKYMDLLDSYSYYRLIYSRLIKYGYSVPNNLTVLFESGDNLFSVVRSLIVEGEYTRARRLLINLNNLLRDIYFSFNEYLKSIYPNPMISKFYRSSYKELITKIDFATSLISIDKGYLEAILNDKLYAYRHSVKKLLNNPFRYPLYEHEQTIRNASLFMWRVWFILNLDKTPFNKDLDRDYLLGMRNNIINLLNEVSNIYGSSGISSESGWASTNFLRLIDFLSSGDRFLFIDNDIRRAFYIYSLVDGYLRYLTDNRDITFNRLSHFSLGVGQRSPYILILDPSSNGSLVMVALDKVILYKDIDRDGSVDVGEVIGEIDLGNALWSVEYGLHTRKFSFSNIYLNISVWVGEHGSEVDLPIYPFTERPLSGPWIKTVTVNYSLNNEIFEGVDSALVVKVVDLEGGLTLRWDHFAATDSFNLDRFRNIPRVSIYINQFPMEYTRCIVALYNRSFYPDTYEIVLVPVSIGDSSRRYHYEFWVKSGIKISDLDFYLSELYKLSPLLILLIAFVLSLILLYSVRYAFLIDIP